MKIPGIPRIRKPAYPKAKSPPAPKPPPLPQAEAPTADMDPDALRAYYDLKNCGDPAERKRIAERYSSLKKESLLRHHHPA